MSDSPTSPVQIAGAYGASPHVVPQVLVEWLPPPPT
jgi:hypothetical protein